MGYCDFEGAILGSGNVIVGFAPAAATPAPGTAVPANADAEAGPIGLFDAILALIGAGQGMDAEGDSTLTPSDGQQANLAASVLPPGLATLLAAQGTTAAASTVVPDEAKAAFGDLMDALSALGESLKNGTPLDPAVENKISEALDKLADLLGLPQVEAAAIDPVIAAAGEVPKPGAGGLPRDTAEAPNDLDPLAAIANGATTAQPQVTQTPDDSATEDSASIPAPTVAPSSVGAPATATSTAARAAPTVAGPTAPQLQADTTQPAAGDVPPGASTDLPRQEAKLVSAVVVQLADRISTLAAALETPAPGLAKRLIALAEKLKSGEIEPETLAKLGLDPSVELPEEEVAAAVERLLGASRETMGAPAPQAFTAASLALPDPITLPSGARPAGSSQPFARDSAAVSDAAPDAKPASDPDDKPDAAPELRSATRSEKADNAPAPRPNANAPVQGGMATTDTQQTQPQPQASPHTAVAATTAAGEAKAVHAAYAAPRQITIPQIAFEIVRQVEAGASRFHIRLDPPELGRVDVKLDVDASGNVHARMTVDRAETLDLMQRDQRALERALAQAGLDSNKTNLEFSLRQNPFARDEQGRGSSGQGSPYSVAGGSAEPDEAAPPPHIIAYRGLASPGGVNLFV